MKRADYTKLEKELKDKIKQPVKYKYPKGERNKKGILSDRCVLTPEGRADINVPYYDVVDKIKFEGEEDNLRIGYYRRIRNRWVWGSQTTITEPISIWKELLKKAAREMPWFRKLLIEVVEETK